MNAKLKPQVNMGFVWLSEVKEYLCFLVTSVLKVLFLFMSVRLIILHRCYNVVGEKRLCELALPELVSTNNSLASMVKPAPLYNCKMVHKTLSERRLK